MRRLLRFVRPPLPTRRTRSSSKVSPSLSARAVSRFLTGAVVAAEEDFVEAYALCEREIERHPEPSAERDRALLHLLGLHLAWADLFDDEYSEALAERLDSAEEALHALERSSPDVHALDLERAAIHLLRASAALRVRDDGEAVRHLDLLRAALSRRGHVGTPRGRLLEARGMTLAARLLSAQGRREEAARAWERAIALWRERHEAFPENEALHHEFLVHLARAATDALQSEHLAEAARLALAARTEFERLDERHSWLLTGTPARPSWPGSTTPSLPPGPSRSPRTPGSRRASSSPPRPGASWRTRATALASPTAPAEPR